MLDVSSDPNTDEWKIEHGWVKIDETNFPDATFRELLLTGKTGSFQDGDLIDQNQDGWLSRDEIADVKWLNITCGNEHVRQIENLKGIEHFTNLEWLTCAYTGLTELDVSKNTALRYLYVEGSRLKKLNVSNNTLLKHLGCNYNQLTELNVSNNKVLTNLECYGSQLKELNVSNNTALTWLDCGGNQLTELNVSKNKALVFLDCDGNQLTELNVSNNTALEELRCDGNQLKELNVSNHTVLTELWCGYNQLTSLDLTNTNVGGAVSNGSGAFGEFSADGNSYNIVLEDDNTYDLSRLPGNFDVNKAKDWAGGSVDGTTLTVEKGVDKVTYTYDCGTSQARKQLSATFTLNVNPVDIPEDGGAMDAAADNIKGALSAIVVGAVAGAIIYETGTGIYRVINMPGIPMPSNRGELAMLLWEHAGKPEPVSTALYSDITEGDIDLNKAAHWAVEQDLMQDNSEKNTFNPRFPVSKLRTCLTWNAAKEKGLFDTDKTAE